MPATTGMVPMDLFRAYPKSALVLGRVLRREHVVRAGLAGPAKDGVDVRQLQWIQQLSDFSLRFIAGPLPKKNLLRTRRYGQKCPCWVPS